MDIWLGANAHGESGWFGSQSLNLRNVREAPEQGAWGATITFGYAVIHIVCHDVPNQRIRLKGDAHRSLRRIWGTGDRVVWPPKLVMRPHDLSPLALIVTEQCSFERAVSRSAPRPTQGRCSSLVGAIRLSALSGALLQSATGGRRS